MEHFNWLAVIFCLYKVIIAPVLFLFYSKICEQFTCIELIGKMSIAYIFQYLQNLNEHFYLCFVTLGYSEVKRWNEIHPDKWMKYDSIYSITFPYTSQVLCSGNETISSIGKTFYSPSFLVAQYSDLSSFCAFTYWSFSLNLSFKNKKTLILKIAKSCFLKNKSLFIVIFKDTVSVMMSLLWNVKQK